jgi:hypothetical protein
MRENHSRPLMSIEPPAKANDNPHEAKQKEPDKIALKEIMQRLHRASA